MAARVNGGRPPAGADGLAVGFSLPPGWVRLPGAGERPHGLLRRDPFAVLARELVSRGAVVPSLGGATAAYLRQIASADPAALGVATLIVVPEPEDRTFVNFAVFTGPPLPRDSAGQPDLDQLCEMAGRGGNDRESEHLVRRVELPCGPAARADWTRPHGTMTGQAKSFVSHWVAPHGLGTVVILLADISPGPSVPRGRILADIQALADSVRIGPSYRP